MKNTLGLLAALVTLSLAVSAQRATGSFVQNGTVAEYSVTGPTYFMLVEIEVDSARGPSGNARIWMNAADWSNQQRQGLHAGGTIPISALKITGATITVNIPNLRNIVEPDFDLSYVGYSDLSINFIVSRTRDSREDISGIYVSRTPQADGTVLMDQEIGKQTRVSASVQGTSLGKEMESYPGYSAYIGQGSFRSHIH